MNANLLREFNWAGCFSVMIRVDHPDAARTKALLQLAQMCVHVWDIMQSVVSTGVFEEPTCVRRT